MKSVLAALCVCGLLCTSDGHFNLYVNQSETKRLLGAPAEVYYVRQSLVHTYALSFKNFRIRPEISEIFFNWQNVVEEKTGYEMTYKLDITSSNPSALVGPKPDIPRMGKVPTIPSVFRVSLHCTGKISDEVTVTIKLEVNIFSEKNFTTLEIKRIKACRKEKNPMTIPHPINLNTSYDIYPPSEPDINPTASTNIFYIAVGCACALILLIAFVVGMCYVRSQKSPPPESIGGSSQGLSSTAAQPYLRPDTPTSSIPGMPRRPFTPLPELSLPEAKMALDELYVERKRISLGEVLMEGTFGQIYQGVLLSENESDIGNEQDVYVKTVSDQARLDQIETLLRESVRLKDINHENINSIIGACLDKEKQPLLVFPYATAGNLKKFLQRCRISDTGSLQTLNTQQLVYMALQIIRGTQFLHKRRIVHKDLATRNCVVERDLRIRLTDTALSRDLFPNDYHCLGDNENRPVKWLAIEGLLHHKFSPASDVWSFGVTLWELMALGQQPYAEIDPFEMATYLKEGYRISQPVNCPDELFAVMACCWAMSPDERPKFSQLLVCLQDFYTALCRYI